MAQHLKTAQPPIRFIRLPEVQHIVGLGRTAIYEKIKVGEFPAQYPLSTTGRAVAWLLDDIEAWIESRVRAGREVPR